MFAQREEIRKILCLSNEEFNYTLKMFGINTLTQLFSENQMELFVDYQQKIGNKKVKDYDERIFSTFEAQTEKVDISELSKDRTKAAIKKQIHTIIKQPDSVLPVKEKLSCAPHQDEAKTKAKAALKTNSRIQIVSACGTGKSYMSQTIAEDMVIESDASMILVIVPSLALLSQFYDSWINNTTLADHKVPFVVCGDKDVVSPEGLAMNKERMRHPFTINTSQEYITSYVKSDTKHKIIFTTYQSIDAVAETFRKHHVAADLAIFDEAHKTVGKRDKTFSFALFDENIKINKRLFMTATQKTYIYETNDDEILSMDDEKIYGPVVYELPMREAIQKGIIKDYKIIVFTIGNDMIQEVKKISTSKTSEELHGDIIASAFLKVVKEKNIKKSLIFHSDIKKSKSFCVNNIFNSGLEENIVHVDGYMSGDKRNRILNNFDKQEFGHVSNSKLFSEGIDVPSIEMVGLFNPSKSIVDITQRVGRVQRKTSPQDQTPGYILLPLFLDETYEELSKYHDWKYIVDILSYLKESDEQIKMLFDAKLHNEQYLERNAIKEVLEKMIDFTGDTTDDMWENSILKKVINEIQFKIYSGDRGKWEINLNKAVAYKNKNGKFPAVSTNQNEEEKTLGLWCRLQRVLRNKGTLLPERIDQLNAIGFSWDPLTENWNKNFDLFYSFVQQNNGAFPQAKRGGTWTSKEERGLNKWLNDQRRYKKAGSLEEWKIEKLQSFVNVWDSREETWEAFYGKFIQFVRENNRLPIDKREGEERIYTWMNNQRGKYISGALSMYKIEKLNLSGLPWNVRADDFTWNNHYAMVEAFISKNKRLPRDNKRMNDEDEYRLAKWCATQRQDYRRKMKKMTVDKIERLEKLGVLV